MSINQLLKQRSMMPNKFYDVLLDGSSSGQDKSQQAEEIKSIAKEEFRFNVVVWFKQKREREGVVVAIMNALNWFDEKSSVLISDSHSSKEDAGQQGEDAGYWKKRCEAAERIVAISGVVNCDGYDYWQSLKNQQP